MTDTDQGAQAANLGGQLTGGPPQQGAPQQNPWQVGTRSPWSMAVDMIRPPGGHPDYLSGERQDPTNTKPQDFISGGPREDHNLWGKPDHILEGARRYPGVTPGPFMPFGQAQMAQVFHQSAAYLGNFGSSGIAPMGAAAAAYQTNYIKGLMQGQEWRARMNRLKMQETAEQLQEQQDKESLGYAEIFSTYQDDPRLKEKLQEYANGTKDHQRDEGMLHALNVGDGISAARRLQSTRDLHNLNLAKTNQQRKDEDTQREREAWGVTSPTTSAPQPTQAPQIASTGGGSVATRPPATALPPAPPRVDAAARDEIMDRKPNVPKDEMIRGAVDDRRNEMETRLDQLPNNPAIAAITDPAARRKAVVDAVRGMHPELANDLTNYLDGVQTPPAGAAGSSGHWSRIISLAQAIDPTLTPERIKTRTATMRDFTSGNDGRNVSSIGTAFRHLRGLANELAANMPGPIDALVGQSRYIPNWFTSEQTREKIGALDARVSTALSEYDRALIGGKPTQKGREAAETLANWRTKDITVVRSAIRVLQEQLHDRLQEQKDRFVAGTGGKASDMLPLFDRNLGANDPETRAALRELDTAQPQVGTRKQFKQGWGVWNGSQWVPEK